MKKNIVEVNFDKLNNNDVIVFKNGKWTAVPSTVFLNTVVKSVNELNEKVDNELRERDLEIKDLKKSINDLEHQIYVLLGEEDPENEEEQ